MSTLTNCKSTKPQSPLPASPRGGEDLNSFAADNSNEQNISNISSPRGCSPSKTRESEGVKRLLSREGALGAPALTFSDLTIGYGKKILAEHLSATLMPSALTCLIGRNGVGKSTLLRTIRRQDCAIVLTGRPPVHNITVEEVVGMGRSPYTNMWGTLRDKDHAIVRESMDRVGITSLAHRDIATLSDGECQKVMIAKALAQQTDIILLDEPTAFLDYPSKLEMVQMLHDIAHERHCAVLLSTHDLDMSLSRADQVWLMTRSHELLTGTPMELSEQIDKELRI